MRKVYIDGQFKYSYSQEKYTNMGNNKYLYSNEKYTQMDNLNIHIQRKRIHRWTI